jgi:hypothetical protein
MRDPKIIASLICALAVGVWLGQQRDIYLPDVGVEACEQLLECRCPDRATVPEQADTGGGLAC